MFQRCMSILIDSKRVWPLASRWLESLEQFSRDPKAAVMGFERGMTEGVRGIYVHLETQHTHALSLYSIFATNIGLFRMTASHA